MLTYWVLFPHSEGHGEAPTCWPLCCQAMWITAGCSKEVQMQSTSQAERQKRYYDRKANALSLEPGDLVLAKANAYSGGQRWRIGGRRNHMKQSAKLGKVSFPTSWKTSGPNAHDSSTEIDFFSLLWQRGLISIWLCRPCRQGAPPPP